MAVDRRLLAAALLACLSSTAAALDNTLTLREALTLAIERDPVVPQAYAQFDAESELGEQERAQLRPSLSVKAIGSFTAADSQFAFGAAQDEFPSWSAYLNARQALLRMDWSARRERADVRDLLADEGQEERRRQFVTRICLRYLDTLLAEDAYDQADSEARAVRESLNDTRKRYEVQLVPGTDLKEAQARDDLAQARLVSARASREALRDALQEVTGYDRSQRLPTLREDLQPPPLDPPDIESWLRSAADNAATTTDARLRLDLARTELASRKAEGLPSADLVGEIGHTDSTDYVLGQRQDDARVGVELSIPIYAGGLNASRVREAEARVREAEAKLKTLTLETERRVRTQFRDVETARAEEQAYRRALESAIVAETATRAGYEAGTRTITDVLDASSRVVQARGMRNASSYQVLVRLLILNATTGRLTLALAYSFDSIFVPR